MAVSLAQCLTHRRHMCVLKQSSSTHKVLDAGVTETIKVTLHSQEIYILTGLKKKKNPSISKYYRWCRLPQWLRQ